MPVSAMFLALMCLTGILSPAQENSSTTLEWVRGYLEEFSVVLDTNPDKDDRELLTTRLIEHPEPETMILVYERSQFDADQSGVPVTRQLINYTFSMADVDPKTLVARPWKGPRSGETFWMVAINIKTSKEFVTYSNLFEQRLPSGEVDVTSSRGKSRTLALGYFRREAQAEQLLELVQSVLDEMAKPEATKP